MFFQLLILFFNYLENYLSISLISLSLKQIICYRLSEIDGSIRTFYIYMYMFFQLLIFFFNYLENYLSISLISLSLKQIICYRRSEIDR